MLPKFRKIDIQSYKPGKSKISRIHNAIKLSANESALGTSKRVLRILNKKIKINKYPDNNSKNLRKQISKKYSCEFEKIICGAGSDEIIQIICQLFLKSKDEVIVPRYSFLMYRIYSKIIGAKIKFSDEENFKVSIKEILKNVNSRTKIVFIANPNNPTGTYLKKEELILLRKKLNQKILLVIDDAYNEYIKKKDYISGLKLFKKSNNVIILRTFSKIYGLASLRIGWGYGPKRIVKEMYKIKAPFNVSSTAQLAAIESLKDDRFVNKSFKHNLFWGKKIRNLLNSYKIHTNEINTNFFLLNFKNCKYSANFIKKKLEKKGIILRSMNIYNIQNCLRLTVGNKSENIKLINTLKLIFK